MLHDRVRDERPPGTPDTLSVGCASDWATLFADLVSGVVVSSAVSELVLGWLSTSMDLSMVASAFGLDPLSHAHARPTDGLRLWNKTGTDHGVRADVGAVVTEDRQLAYAVICNWPPDTDAPRAAVQDAMGEIGNEILALIKGQASSSP